MPTPQSIDCVPIYYILLVSIAMCFQIITKQERLSSETEIVIAARGTI